MPMHKKYILILTLLLTACFLAFSGCEITISTNGTNNPLDGGSPSSSTTHLGAQTKMSGCLAHGGLPDSACTPVPSSHMQLRNKFASTDIQGAYATSRTARKTRP